MLFSQYFLPILKEAPKDATIPSHILMLRAGMIRQSASGIYTWLPLGLRVLAKIEAIVRQEMDKTNCQELLMPTIQKAELWQESGRGNYGKETLNITDRHKRELIYSPTNEEVITDIFRKNITSYKNLPFNLYQIQWKFRDEIRPRFGVMRGREFLMKDAYSFDIDEQGAATSYNNMFACYLNIFKNLGLLAVPFRAATGVIGGDLSHEFHVIAKTGESEVFYDDAFLPELKSKRPDINLLKDFYAATGEKHNPDDVPQLKGNLQQARGIEVGQIFYFADKYSKPMKALVKNQQGKDIAVKMGAYGIGVSRLVGAIIEAHHDDDGIIFPRSVAPFDAIILNLKQGDLECDSACEKLYNQLRAKGVDVLYDNRKEAAGSKFKTADLIGIPVQIAIGSKYLQSQIVEVKNRLDGIKKQVTIEDIANRDMANFL